MPVIELNPYLHFNGNAEQAMKLYESALGAKWDGVMRYGDVPNMNAPAESKNLVLHARLTIGDHVLMVSDTTPDRPVKTEGNVEITLHYDDAAEMAKAFEALAAGGKVIAPLADTFWGAKFGVLADPFGVRWMFNCQKQQ